MRNNQRVCVYVIGLHGPDWPPSNATEFIEWLSAKVATVPPEYRESAMIEFEAEDDCGSIDKSIHISYLRPETDDEMSRREYMEHIGEEMQQKRELAELAKLKAKYES